MRYAAGSCVTVISGSVECLLDVGYVGVTNEDVSLVDG